MTTAAAIKAWETRRRNFELALSGDAPVQKPQLYDDSAQLTPGRKAWLTRMANLAKAVSAETAAISASAPKPRRPHGEVQRLSAIAVPTELSAGLKAAATRKAVEIAREALRATDAPSDITPGQSISIWLEDSDVGSGERVFVVQDIGPKQVSLFYPPLVRSIKVDRRTFDLGAKTFNTSALKVSRRIHRAVTSFDSTRFSSDRANRLEYSPREVRSVEDLVRSFFENGGEIKRIPTGTRTRLDIDDVRRIVNA